jgi:hypothetical protein
MVYLFQDYIKLALIEAMIEIIDKPVRCRTRPPVNRPPDCKRGFTQELLVSVL